MAGADVDEEVGDGGRDGEMEVWEWLVARAGSSGFCGFVHGVVRWEVDMAGDPVEADTNSFGTEEEFEFMDAPADRPVVGTGVMGGVGLSGGENSGLTIAEDDDGRSVVG